MKPHGTRIKSKPSYGALISFSGMQSALALFSQPRAFVSFVSTKEKKDDYWQQIIIKAREAGA